MATEVIDMGDQQVPIEPLAPTMYAAGAGSVTRDGFRAAASSDKGDARKLAMGATGRTAAAIAAGQIISSFIDHPAGGAQTLENAQRITSELAEQISESEIGQAHLPDPVVTPVSRTDSGLHVVQQPQEEPMPTDYELPAELGYLNETEQVDDLDLDDEVEVPEPVAAAPEPEAEFDDDDLLDPRIAALVAERDKLKKQAAHERNVRVKTTRPTWEQEAKRVFRLGDVPLLDDDDLAGIKADSKRSFMTQAKQIADRNKRVIIRVAPAQRSPQEVRAEQKADEWGPPPASAPPADVTDNDREARLAKARRSGNLGKIFGAMIDNGSGR